MNLEELLAWIRERMDDGEYATVETFLNDMDKRGRDADEFRAAAEARYKELNGQIESLTADNQNLKARNYDLLMQIPADEHIDGDGAVEEVVEDDGELYHIDNLFVDPDEKKMED